MMTQEQSAAERGSTFEAPKRKVMRTPDGRELPAGRVKGQPNKLTVALKDAVEISTHSRRRLPRRRQQSHRRPQEHAKGRVARVAWARARSRRLRLPSSPARPAWPWVQA